MSNTSQKAPFWRKFFGPPSKELADVRAMTNGIRHSARLLRISAASLALKATEVADVARISQETLLHR